MGHAFQIDHIVKSIETCKKNTDPFPYFTADNIFSDADYDAVKSHIPADDYFVTVAPNVLRLDFMADPASQGDGAWDLDARLEPDHPFMPFLKDFKDAILSDAVMDAFLDAFDIKRQDGHMASGRLCWDQQGAGAGPHRDRIDKIVSAIFYIPIDPDPDSEKTSGTRILLPIDPAMELSDKHYTFDQFRTADHIDYVPNRATAFKVCRGPGRNHSFHGYRHDQARARFTFKYHVHDLNLLEAGLSQVNDPGMKQSARDWARQKAG